MDLKKFMDRYGVALIVFAFLVLLTILSSVHPSGAVMIDVAGKTNNVKLPLFLDNASSQTYKVAFDMNHFLPLQNLIHIVPDNRVASVSVNGMSVPLNEIPSQRLEDWEKGFTIDLGHYLAFGRNSVAIELVNFGGPMSLSFNSSIAESVMILALLVLICLLVLAFLGDHTGFSRDRLEHTAAILIAVLLAFLFRYFFLPYQSGDYGSYLAWFLDIKHNGFRAFGSGASNYAPSYLYLLGLSTLLPVSNIIAIKSIPILFDFITAIYVYRIVRQFYPKNGLVALFSLVSFLFLPTVWLNSATWGQCDSIFMSFIVISVYYLITNRIFASMVFYSVAVSLKLQALFVGPLYMVFLFQRVIPLRYFFLIPGVYLLSVIPAWIAGRPLIDLLLIYARQGSWSSYLTHSAATFYQWTNNSWYFINGGLAFTLGIVLVLAYLFWKGMSGRPVKKERFIEIGLLFSLIVPFFLPMMHERYFYPADVLSLLYAFIRPKRFYVALIVMLSSLFSYGPFLFGVGHVPLPYVSIAMVFVMALVLTDLVRDLFPGKMTSRKKAA